MQKSIYTQQHRRLRGLLIEARKNAGLTQVEVAERLWKPQSFVAKYEGGERRPDVVEFLAVPMPSGSMLHRCWTFSEQIEHAP